MKNIFLSILLLQLLHGFSQDIDRTKAPQPSPAPVINIPDALTFTMPNGLKVFVVRNTKLPQVNATLTIDREAIKEGNKAGMSDMAGQLMRYGTTKMNKEKLDESIDFLGGSVTTSSLSATSYSLTKNFPQVFSLMADVVLHPAMSATELEKIRKQTLSGLESEKDDPDAISRKVSNVLMYGKDHPFGEIETDKTVNSVTAADVKKFYAANWKPNNAYLVFVGDITMDDAKKLAIKYFGGWAKGAVSKEIYVTVKAPSKTYIAVIDRPVSVQSVIKISTPVQLRPGADDAITASLTNTILGGGFSSRLMQNLREKYGFTYGARSSLTGNRIVGNFSAGASVRNEKTDSSIAQMIYEFKRINETVAADTEISSIKNYMSGGFARSLEQPSTIANFALNIARYNLPKDYYRNYLKKLSATTPQQIQLAATKYITPQNMIITIVGNAKEISKGLEKYGEVKYFDIYGNEVAPPVVKMADVNIKGEDVLKKAIDAYGGETAINAIKDMQFNGSVSVMGQALEYTQKNIAPGNFGVSVSMAGMTIMKQSKKDTIYVSEMQGAAIPLDDKMKEEMNAKADVIEEHYILSKQGYKLKVKAIEPIDGKDAYAVLITSPQGNETTAYYDVISGLKVQDVRESETPMGKLTITSKFSDYKTFEGINVPTKITVDLGQFKQDITIKDVKINQGLKLSDL